MKTPASAGNNAILRSGRIVRVGFIAAMVLIVGISLFAVFALRQASGALDQLVYNEQLAMELQFRMLQAARERSVELYYVATIEDPFEIDAHVLHFGELGGRFGSARNKLMQLDLDAKSRSLLEKQGREAAVIIGLMDEVISLALQGRRDEAISLLVNQAIPAQEAMMATINAMLERQIGASHRKAEALQRQQGLSAWLLVVAGLAAALLAVLIARHVRQGMGALLGEISAAVQNLQEANRQLEYQKLALDQHDILAITDVYGDITYVNDKFCETSQHNREELIGRNHRVLKSGLHPDSFYRELWDTVTHGRVWKGEMCNRRKDGSLYWVATTIVPFLDDVGLPYQYVSVRTDITDIKQAQEVLLRGREELERLVQERTVELAEREEMLRSITRYAHDGVIMLDPAGRITFWNPAAENIFGYAEAEVQGRDLRQMLTSDAQAGGFRDDFEAFLQSGADAFLGKTFELAASRKEGGEVFVEISLSLVKVKGNWHAVGIVRDITARKRAERHLEFLAMTDPLTGAANRRRFDEALHAEIARSRHYAGPLSLIIFDIDHFKQVNDRLGHPVGDRALTQLAQRVSANIRETDVFARLGGEEFAILVSGCDADCACRFAEKLRCAIEQQAFPEVGTLTCSFGVAEYRKTDDEKALVKRADEALYRAKGAGRNRVVVADGAA